MITITLTFEQIDLILPGWQDDHVVEGASRPFVHRDPDPEVNIAG